MKIFDVSRVSKDSPAYSKSKVGDKMKNIYINKKGNIVEKIDFNNSEELQQKYFKEINNENTLSIIVSKGSSTTLTAKQDKYSNKIYGIIIFKNSRYKIIFFLTL